MVIVPVFLSAKPVFAPLTNNGFETMTVAAWHVEKDYRNGYNELSQTISAGGNLNGNISPAMQSASNIIKTPNPNRIPEPLTFFLLGSCLIGLAGLRKKIKR